MNETSSDGIFDKYFLTMTAYAIIESLKTLSMQSEVETLIECYKTGTNGTVLIDEPESGCWINVVEPTQSERDWLQDELGVLPEFVRASLDEEETSHIDFDDEVDQTFIIVDYPSAEDIEDMTDPDMLQYRTLPLSVIFLQEQNMVVTISANANYVIEDLARGRVRNIDTRLRTRFLLLLLLRVSQRFLIYLRRIDNLSTKNEKLLYNSMENDEIVQLLALQKSLVYFSTSLKSDEVTINKIMHGRIIRLYEEDQELLEDVLIEIHQAQEMCAIYSNILTGMMDAFGSIISNNLNIVMKVLTVITIVMSIPNIIFGFYGMNVGGLPFCQSWIGPVLIACALMALATFIFKKNDMFH